ncbi:hypothetical protein PGTUg99_019913 [Puccinia graminis f. sp. tritici]|uniref:Uncharacterized protein n=2 Tax=Puccinia graminis f. sp. tritici TaxID=56615 RepID=A0A5B0M2X8_PUCGR|nr:hypothetical protein PGTUg99_019913 [Puccinia graminis f. sp. tritici]
MSKHASAWRQSGPDSGRGGDTRLGRHSHNTPRCLRLEHSQETAMVDKAIKRATRSKEPKSTPTSTPAATTEGHPAATLEGNLSDPNALENAMRPASSLPTDVNRQALELDSESDDSEAFKEIPDQNTSERPSNLAKYKGICSNFPKIITTGKVSVTVNNPDQVDTLINNEDTSTLQQTSMVATLKPQAIKSDKAILWDKIADAVAANDKTNADFFIRLYSQIDDSAHSLKPDILRSHSSDAGNPLIAPSSSKKTPDKTSIIFVRGSLPKHFDVGFTPYFDKNIRELRGPIPLTIFDKKWQEEAIQYHTNKRSKGDEKEGSYTGFEYPNEWTQTFAKWTANHRNFHVTFRDLYNYPDFAEWILEHKANVDRIIAEDGFLVGFRYDLIIRQNAFSYQVKTKQGISAVDISIFRKEVKQEAWKVTRNLDELKFSDNPYAKDGPKFNFDPKTGKPKIAKGKTVDEPSHQVDNRSSRGRGNFRKGRGSDRFHQERRISDYGNYCDDSYGHDQSGGMKKRPREFYQQEDYSQGRHDYYTQRGGYDQRGSFGKDRPAFNKGNSSKPPTKNEMSKGKGNDNL